MKIVEIKNADLSIKPIILHWFYIFLLVWNILGMIADIYMDKPVIFIMNYASVYFMIVYILSNYEDYTDCKLIRGIDKFLKRRGILNNYKNL